MYIGFQLREAGGILSAVYGLVLLYLLRQYHAGEDAFAWFQATMSSLPFLLLTFVVFGLVLVHAVSWFALIGKAQPVQFTREPLPWQKVFVGNLAIWAVVSVLVLLIVFGGL